MHHRERDTRPGFALAELKDDPDPRAPARPARLPAGPLDHAPLVDIEIIHQMGEGPPEAGPLRTLEVWTLNTLYVMDASMVCIEVRDRNTGTPDPGNSFLGRRLVGGQRTEGDVIELSYPFPRPGTEAVFELDGGPIEGLFGRTSTVVHVRLRMHLVTVAPQGVVPSWATIRTSIRPPSER
ncbi:MAG: hypothetical protein U0230_05425 [Polyangiales bacterium]